MHAELLDLTIIAHDGLHNAFTSLCQWHGQYYCAWRVAPTHHITPPGYLVISQRARSGIATEVGRTILALPGGDCRDPRLYATPEAIYLLCGAYLPAPHQQHWHGLSRVSTDNILQTYWSYTTDGQTWAPLAPTMRPNYWGWSVLRSKQERWVVAAYHMGTSNDISGSLSLFIGETLDALTYAGTLYDGIDLTTDGSIPHTPHYLPCEPVLWQPTPDTLACCARTEAGMDIGISHVPFQNWRWHNTALQLHPSAMLLTPYGWLLAVREVLSTRPRKGEIPTPPTWRTALYTLPAGLMTPRHLLTLPSAGDTGYAGLVLDYLNPKKVYVTFYSQHLPQHPTVTNTLPGTNVWLATVGIGM